MEKESINGGAKGQCPVMEIAFRKGRSCFLIQEPRGRESMGVCVYVCGLWFICARLRMFLSAACFFLLEEGSKAISWNGRNGLTEELVWGKWRCFVGNEWVVEKCHLDCWALLSLEPNWEGLYLLIRMWLVTCVFSSGTQLSRCEQRDAARWFSRAGVL